MDPTKQRLGIGAKLLQDAELRAQRYGATEMACDTAKDAERLVNWYRRCGYTVVAEVRWPKTDHENVVLSKRLVSD